MKKNTEIKPLDRNHLKFIFDDVRYDIGKTETTCYISGTFESTWPMVECVKRAFKSANLKPSVYYKGSKVGRVHAYYEFEANVNCHETDTYDETVGMRLAESKAKEKVFLKEIDLTRRIKMETMKEMKKLDNLRVRYLLHYVTECIHQFVLDRKQNYKSNDNQ